MSLAIVSVDALQMAAPIPVMDQMIAFGLPTVIVVDGKRKI
jgi:hypothetical protein